MCRILLHYLESLLPFLHSLKSSHSAALFAVFLPFLRLSYKLLPALHKYIPIPLSHPHISKMGYNIRSRRIKNLNKLHVIFIIVNLPQLRVVYGVGLRSLACWDCGFESRRRHGCLSVVSIVCCQVEVPA